MSTEKMDNQSTARIDSGTARMDAGTARMEPVKAGPKKPQGQDCQNIQLWQV